jgi:hypothetical protein
VKKVGYATFLFIYIHPKKQIWLRYRSKNIIPSSRAGFALKKRSLLYKQKTNYNAALTKVFRPNPFSFGQYTVFDDNLDTFKNRQLLELFAS